MPKPWEKKLELSQAKISYGTANISCGVGSISGLRPDVSPEDQAIQIWNVMRVWRGSDIILISDNFTEPNRWAATKAIAMQSPVVVNRNSNNKIAVWCITEDMLEKIYYYGKEKSV